MNMVGIIKLYYDKEKDIEEFAFMVLSAPMLLQDFGYFALAV